MMTIDPDKVCRLILLARRFDVKVGVVEPDPGSNMAEDEMVEVLEDYPDDNVENDILGYIRELNVDEQVELVALAWIGRGSYTADEWKEALSEARLSKGAIWRGQLLVGLRFRPDPAGALLNLLRQFRNQLLFQKRSP